MGSEPFARMMVSAVDGMADVLVSGATLPMVLKALADGLQGCDVTIWEQRDEVAPLSAPAWLTLRYQKPFFVQRLLPLTLRASLAHKRTPATLLQPLGDDDVFQVLRRHDISWSGLVQRGHLNVEGQIERLPDDITDADTWYVVFASVDEVRAALCVPETYTGEIYAIQR